MSTEIGVPITAAVGTNRKGLALAVIAIAQLTVVLDVSIVNVALPSIQQDLGFSATGLEWIVNAYALAFGGLLLLGGRIADVYGKRRTLIAGLGLLVVASTAGGLAPDAGWLIGARVAQGVAGALIAPAALALIATTFAEGHERNRAMGVYAAMSGAGGALGNVLGGVLTTGLSWRWVLFVNIPIGIFAAVLAPRAFQRTATAGGRMDLAGALTVTAGVSSIVYGLMHASSDSWGSAGTYGPLTGGAVALLTFVLIEARQPSPLMPLRIWADRNRAGAYVVMLVVGAATIAVFYFLTLFMQIVLGYSALRTGFAFLAFAVGAGATAGISGRLVGRIGPRPLLGVGLLTLASGLFWLSFLDADARYLGDLAGPLVLAGCGVGLCFVPLTLAAVVRVDHDAAGISSALLNTCQQVGGGLGLAVFGTIAATAARHRLDTAVPGLGAQAHAGGGGPMPPELRRLISDALADGYGLAYLVAAVTLAVACVIGVIAIREVADEGAAVPIA
ncbi:MFS transporter [Nocardia sp. NBC_00403]|uniref:MFS transporter n=1 Tax=Nocardia sp. NBC_00403 TaxID=2975990 RepID=UPI002E1F3A1D